MPDLLHWSTFFTTSIVLLLIPGPSVIYLLTSGIEHGRRGVVLSSIGLALGDFVQVLCTVVGISALLASSPVVFAAVKYTGAAYLILLGVSRLLVRGTKRNPKLGDAGETIRNPSRSLIMQAFLALNPKTAVFFLALFPQFVAENAGPAWLQILLFGCAFVVLGLVTNSLYGFLGRTLTAMWSESSRFSAATRYISGTFLIAMGVAAALAAGPHKPV